MFHCKVGAHPFKIKIEGSKDVRAHKKELYKKMTGGGKSTATMGLDGVIKVKVPSMFKVDVIPVDEQQWRLVLPKNRPFVKDRDIDDYVLRDTDNITNAGVFSGCTVIVTRQKVEKVRVLPRSTLELVEEEKTHPLKKVCMLYDSTWIPETSR